MAFQGRFFIGLKRFARRFDIAQCDAPPKADFPEPAVYICRHSNLKGPILSLANIPIEVHPWVLHAFCDAKTCRQHCAEYTFSVRFCWKKWVANLAATAVARAFTGLVHSAGSIPVYRNSPKVRETFRQSLEALKRGESILIFPDVNYTTQLGDAGELYEGFLMLEQMYFKAEGKHLTFMPMHVSDAQKKLALGQAVRFADGVPFPQEKGRVLQALKDAMNAMMEEYGK